MDRTLSIARFSAFEIIVLTPYQACRNQVLRLQPVLDHWQKY